MNYVGDDVFTRMAVVFDEDYFKIGSAVRIRAGANPDTIQGVSPEAVGLWKLLSEEYEDKWVNCIVGGHSGGSGIVLGVQVMFIREKTKERWLRWVQISDVKLGVIEMEVQDDH